MFCLNSNIRESDILTADDLSDKITDVEINFADESGVILVLSSCHDLVQSFGKYTSFGYCMIYPHVLLKSVYPSY